MPAQAGPAQCVGAVNEFKAVALAGHLYTLGDSPSNGGEVRPTDGPPAPRLGARHAGQGREEGGVGGGRAAARGGEVMARRSGAAMLVPAAG